MKYPRLMSVVSWVTSTLYHVKYARYIFMNTNRIHKKTFNLYLALDFLELHTYYIYVWMYICARSTISSEGRLYSLFGNNLEKGIISCESVFSEMSSQLVFYIAVRSRGSYLTFISFPTFLPDLQVLLSIIFPSLWLCFVFMVFGKCASVRTYIC